MALYRKDRAQLSQGADALAKLILGEENRQREQASSQAHDLTKLDKGAEIEQAAVSSNEQRARDFAESQGLPAGKYSINASQSGYGVNPEPAKDPLEMFFKGEALRQRQEDKDEKAVQQLSKRVEGAQLGPSQSALQNLGRSVQEKGPAIGPISANAPVWSVSLAEQFGLAGKGATEQRQSVDALMAFQRNPLFGASLTPGEQQSFQNAFGLMTAGTAEQRQQAMQTLETLYNKATANVAAGSPQRIRNKYKEQGGISLEPSNVFAGQATTSGMDPAKKSRLEQLRAKHRGGQ